MTVTVTHTSEAADEGKRLSDEKYASPDDESQLSSQSGRGGGSLFIV